ncbi:hypothetical protein [Rhizobium etli]|nr:hypothetical protein [Rhizobium etli]
MEPEFGAFSTHSPSSASTLPPRKRGESGIKPPVIDLTAQDTNDNEQGAQKKLVDALKVIGREQDRKPIAFEITLDNLTTQQKKIMEKMKVDMDYSGTQKIRCDLSVIRRCTDLGIKVTVHSCSGGMVSQ